MPEGVAAQDDMFYGPETRNSASSHEASSRPNKLLNRARSPFKGYKREHIKGNVKDQI